MKNQRKLSFSYHQISILSVLLLLDKLSVNIMFSSFSISDRDHISCDITCMDFGEINEEKN